jgi:hypothetical protein
MCGNPFNGNLLENLVNLASGGITGGIEQAANVISGDTDVISGLRSAANQQGPWGSAVYPQDPALAEKGNIAGALAGVGAALTGGETAGAVAGAGAGQQVANLLLPQQQRGMPGVPLGVGAQAQGLTPQQQQTLGGGQNEPHKGLAYPFEQRIRNQQEDPGIAALYNIAGGGPYA